MSRGLDSSEVPWFFVFQEAGFMLSVFQELGWRPVAEGRMAPFPVVEHLDALAHATIAALSTGVPTISIAYSVKARGINRDLFGHEDVVLPTPSVSATTLGEHLQYLMEKENLMKERLADRIPAYRQAIDSAIGAVAELIHG